MYHEFSFEPSQQSYRISSCPSLTDIFARRFMSREVLDQKLDSRLPQVLSEVSDDQVSVTYGEPAPRGRQGQGLGPAEHHLYMSYTLSIKNIIKYKRTYRLSN